MILDVHAPYFPKAYNGILMRIGGRSLPEAARPSTARPIRQDDPAGIPTRLQQMDDAGVQVSGCCWPAERPRQSGTIRKRRRP